MRDQGEIMQIRSTVVVLTAAMLLTGCSMLSALNPFGSKEAPRNPPAPLTAFTPSLNVRTAWSANVGKAGDSAFTPAIAANSVFAAAADGTIARIDLNSGR